MVIFQLILNILLLNFFKLVWFIHIYCHKNSKINKTSKVFDGCFAPKTVFWKIHYWVATTTDCFEPIFGFLRSFWFEKYRSAPWNRIGMFSELSGRSVFIITYFQSDWSLEKSFGESQWNFFSLYLSPSSIYSWSIGHILEHEFFCLGHLGCAGSKGKKVDLRNSEQLFRVVFSTFGGQKKNLKFF